VKHVKVTLALCVVLAAGVGAVGCGGDDGMPSDAVATVDGQAIDRESFNRWLEITAKTNGKPREQVRDQVMHELLTGLWIESEAEDRGISVDSAAVRREFERQKRLSFPEDADFQRFLKSSGQTQKHILERVRLDLLSGRIRDEVTGKEREVTEDQIVAHFNRNKASFKQPEQRDLRVVVAPSKANAAAAYAELARGESWSAVARRHSIDRASRSDGGRVLRVTRAEQDKALGDAVFESRVGELRGPVKAEDGYYVFEVTRVFRARQQTLDEARPTIERLLISEGRRKRLNEFTEEFRDKWRKRTECREGYVTSDCKNGPETPAKRSNGHSYSVAIMLPLGSAQLLT
jgi:parvulin-like peptidyl-prolyl isomerase